MAHAKHDRALVQLLLQRADGLLLALAGQGAGDLQTMGRWCGCETQPQAASGLACMRRVYPPPGGPWTS